MFTFDSKDWFRFIFFFVLTLPFSFVITLGYRVIPVVLLIFYALTSLEKIAEEIEDTFDGDENDLPILKMAESIKKPIAEILYLAALLLLSFGCVTHLYILIINQHINCINIK